MTHGIELIEVIGIKEEHFSGRGEIIGARNLLGTLLRLVQRGEQHARQNRDNGNDHEIYFLLYKLVLYYH